MSASETHMMKLRDELIEAMLPHVPFDGWSREALRMAAEDLDMPKSEAERLLPGGSADYVLYACRKADRQTKQQLDELDLASMKIRERIATAVQLRILQDDGHKDAVRKAMSLMSMPQNSVHAMKSVYETVDMMWYAAGDNATDWNYYSKRTLLAGVYSSTMLYWLNDTSENYQVTWAFLDRRIENVMQIPKVKAKAKDVFSKLTGIAGMRRQALHRFKAKTGF